MKILFSFMLRFDISSNDGSINKTKESERRKMRISFIASNKNYLLKKLHCFPSERKKFKRKPTRMRKDFKELLSEFSMQTLIFHQCYNKANSPHYEFLFPNINCLHREIRFLEACFRLL